MILWCPFSLLPLRVELKCQESHACSLSKTKRNENSMRIDYARLENVIYSSQGYIWYELSSGNFTHFRIQQTSSSIFVPCQKMHLSNLHVLLIFKIFLIECYKTVLGKNGLKDKSAMLLLIRFLFPMKTKICNKSIIFLLDSNLPVI